MAQNRYTFSGTPGGGAASHPTGTQNPEANLAYMLQHGAPRDPDLLEVLFERYGAEVYRLLAALAALDVSSRAPRAGRERVGQITRQVLLQAVRQPDQFWGQEGVREWLYALALSRWYGARRLRKLTGSLAAVAAGPPTTAPVNPSTVSQPGSTAELAALNALPEAQRLVLILRYGHGLSMSQILACLDQSAGGQLTPEGLSLALAAARWSVFPAFGGELVEECPGWPESPAPSVRLQQQLDGLLEMDPYAAAALQAHLAECPACSAESRAWENVTARLSAAIRTTYTGFSAAEKQGLLEDLRARLAAGPQARLNLPWRMISLGGLLLLALAAVGLVFQQIGTRPPASFTAADPDAAATTSPRRGTRSTEMTLPTPIPVPLPAIADQQGSAGYTGPNVVWSGSPVLSGDGRFLAFSSGADYWVAGDTNDVNDIFVYDLQTDTVERVSQRAGRQASAASFSPTISADGRYIAYLTQAANLLTDDARAAYCLPGGQVDPDACQDLVLYDRETGASTWISQAVDGAFLNAYQAHPVLSADGSTLVFFSSAQQFAGLLPDSSPSACPAEPVQASWGHTCGDLYAYDVPSGTLERIPLGRLLGAAIRAEPVVSLSGDGRYVAFTLSQQDYIYYRGRGPARRPNVPLLPAEAYVYDRQTQAYLPLDRPSAQAGMPDAPSYNPVLSRDGRFAAFVSEANNLVPEDGNGMPDVYLRELASGKLELISKDARGQPGAGPSGVFLTDLEPHRERLALSADGRYVAFLSAAPNLILGQNGAAAQADLCSPWEYGEICAGLYLHDREAGTTTLVTSARNALVFHDPVLADDGSVLVYSDEYLNCLGRAPYQICADLWLFNSRTGELLSLSQQYSPRAQSDELSRQLAQALAGDSLAELAGPGEPLDLPPLSGEVVEIENDGRGRLATLDLSPDGRLLATGMDIDSVVLRDTHTLEIIDRLEESGQQVSAVRFSPGGNWLGASTSDGAIHLWRTEDLGQSSPDRAITLIDSKSLGAIFSLDFSPDDKWLAVGSYQGLWIWGRDGQSFTLRDDQSILGIPVHTVAFSAEVPRLRGSILAAGLEDGTTLLVYLPNDEVRIETPVGRVRARLGGHTDDVISVAFSPGGELFATGGLDGAVNIWQLDLTRRDLAPEHLSRVEGDHRITSLAFSPSGETLAAGAFGLALEYIDVATGKIVDNNTEFRRRNVISLQPTSDGSRLFVGTGLGSLLVFSTPVVAEPRYFQVLAPEAGELAGEEPGIPFYASTVRSALPMRENDFSRMWVMPAHLLGDLPADRLEDLYVPTSLPEHMRMLAFYLLDSAEEAPIQYFSGADGEFNGVLVLRQGRLDRSDVFAWRIGPQTAVRQVSLDFLPAIENLGTSQVPAELVVGGWRGTPEDVKYPLVWDPQIPMATLRWSVGDTGFMLQYLVLGEVGTGQFRLEDLVSTASSLRLYRQLSAVEPIEVPYRTVSGQTCTGLAERFGTTVVNLIRINRAAYQYLSTIGCEMLDPGIEIVVPVAPQPYISSDLDCDGMDERLQLLPNPDDGLFGFLLQVLDENGVYIDQALTHIEDNRVQTMQPPMLVQAPDHCGQYVAVHVNQQEFPGPSLRLMAWDGEHFNTILDGQGELVDLRPEEDQFVARSQWLQPDSGGNCLVMQADYIQVGAQFEQFSNEVIAMVDCFPLPAPPEPGAAWQLHRLADLDCDLTPEILRAAGQPGDPAGFYTRLQILHREADGSLSLLVEYAAPPGGSGRFGEFQVIPAAQLSSGDSDARPDDCRQLIVLPELDAAGHITSSVFLDWDGHGLTDYGRLPGRVLQAGAYSYGGGLVMVAPRQVQPGLCVPLQTIYTWQGEAFVEMPYAGQELPAVCPPGAD